MIWQYLRKEKQGQIGQRHKTIILLRVSTVTQPPEVARGRRNDSVGQLLRLSNKKPQQTQQNKNFVAFAVQMCYNNTIQKLQEVLPCSATMIVPRFCGSF